ncbi:endopolygalacturonase [Pectobacterium polaris]|uniref:glycoside hydrolase family 28 protein n=1 Tax=Pectobacterium polaris TaxID=2042057 RepID=UPI000D60B58E|nr:glycosyl hydrolase family 28 protein [Pectobacterium polaris]MCU1789244.1 endopolygalacturonase [Pectobacterium polaris]PWD59109.1 endopolygalacturonase [Pectobacterium polaris]
MAYQLGKRVLLLLGLFGLFSASVSAADLRTVSEPQVPSSCTVLTATDSIATSTIQDALNHCAQGEAVKLSPGSQSSVFLSGPLSLPSGVNLIIDKAVTLQAVNNAQVFENAPSSCGVVDKNGKGCNALITATSTTNSGVYGPGTIDGQGGAILQDKKVSWWDLAADAKARNLKQNVPRLIQIDQSKNFTLYNVMLINGPGFHTVFRDSDGFTAWETTIKTPLTAKNTDGIDIMSSKNVTIAHCHIATGDDNVAIKAFEGRSASRDISIVHNDFGTGHGMSIGSETMGVYSVVVDDLVMNGTTNGLRIKSDKSSAGQITGVRYSNVVMDNVEKPIVIDTVYENKAGNHVPDWSDITYENVTSKTKGVVVLNGENAAKPIEITMKNVTLTPDTQWQIKNVKINQ